MKKWYTLQEVNSGNFYRNGLYDLVDNATDTEKRHYTLAQAENWLYDVTCDSEDNDNASSRACQKPDFFAF